ncbi:hypothetical protein ACIP2X_28560 [Streptomyces sp. NPDC089424]|uniref:hypothetical protein n=1 Tax=Streptomyces sp. NPDC089424 TaxID=3365917 RepID=UPI003800A731
MTHLTADEERHAASLTAIRDSPRLNARCGDLAQLAEPVEELLPLYEHNEDWDEVRLDDDLMTCALRFTDLGAQWETTDGLPELYGEFRILHFYDVFEQPEGPSPLPDATDFQRGFLSELRSFDRTPRSGAGMMSYIRMQPRTTPLEIWYQDIADIGVDPYPPGLLKMDVTYCQYLDALLLTKGTYGWQYLFTDISLGGSGFRNTVRYLERMLEIFPELFPEHDYSDLRDRLEARR